MRPRAPIVLSTAALAVAVLGTTPLGHAAGDRLAATVPFAKTSGFAKVAGNSAKLNGRPSTLSGAPGTIPVVGKDGKLPAGVGAVGPRGPQGERGLPGPAGPAGASTGGGRPGGAAGGGLTGSYPNPGIAGNAVGSAQVVDNGLTGADVNESTLQIPASALGGLGLGASKPGSKAFGLCDPESTVFISCATATLNLPVKTHVLVIGRVVGTVEDGDATRAWGDCRLSTGATGVLPDSGVGVQSVEGHALESTDNATLVEITPPVGPGSVSFAIDCNQIDGAIKFLRSRVTAVAISAS
jgi:hypothetical protein